MLARFNTAFPERLFKSTLNSIKCRDALGGGEGDFRVYTEN